jgi:hypothetical protein
MNYFLGIARFGFLALLVLFVFYVLWIIRRDME